MTRSDFSRPEPSSPGSSPAIDQTTFSQLYDQYAPALLGVITGIVSDKDEAVRLLEITFVKIRSQYGLKRPASQPLFIWLLSVARATALETKSFKASGQPVLRLIGIGKKVSLSENRNAPTPFVTDIRKPVPSSVNELLDAVLFKNFTPEEAVSAIGLPPTTARQQLRTAMQQFRTSSA